MADRVLIVEDDPDVAKFLRGVLERAGDQVTLLTDGLEAVEWAVRERPDAIVLDVTLPTIDGFEVRAGSDATTGRCSPSSSC